MMRLIQMVLLLTGLLMVAAPGHVQEKMTGVSRRPRSAPARLGMADCGSGYLDDYGSIEKF